MSRYTRGPLEIARHDPPGRRGFWHIRTETGEWVASVRTKADATLFAVSSDLIEATKALVRHDVNQDKRERLPHCIEVIEAQDVIVSAGNRKTGRIA